MSFAHRISAYNRKRKWDFFLSEYAPTPEMRILDVGFSDREYSPVDNYIEKHYPYPEMLTALGIDQPVEFTVRYPAVTVVCYDGDRFPFSDNAFDVVWSNAVIEHVGNRARQLVFLQEIHRVAKKAFITTPNRYFPVELHTRTPLLHYLPKGIFDRYLALVGKRWAAGKYMRLLSRADLKALFADAGIAHYSIVCNRLGPFTLDFIMMF